jgi:hypothetical protein
VTFGAKEFRIKMSNLYMSNFCNDSVQTDIFTNIRETLRTAADTTVLSTKGVASVKQWIFKASVAGVK